MCKGYWFSKYNRVPLHYSVNMAAPAAAAAALGYMAAAATAALRYMAAAAAAALWYITAA
jgi:small-conductance mechanosensitive channel